MTNSGKITVTLAADYVRRIDQLVDSGEFSSRQAVLRQALRAWLKQRAQEAMSQWSSRSFAVQTRDDAPDVVERVELLFDAADAKA